MLTLEQQKIKPGSALYGSIHKWLVKEFGKAKICENKECKNLSKKFHYALLKKKNYDYKRGNFLQLCVSCHMKYDRTSEWNQAIKKSCAGVNKGNKHPAKQILQYSLDGKFIKEWESARDAARSLKISHTSISMVCNGSLKKAGNFLWKFKKIYA